MPELPEVETIRSQLHARLKGSSIVQVDVWKTGREFPEGQQFVAGVVGKHVAGIERRAKLLVWRFSDGTAMIAHLKMTGRFTFVPSGYQPEKHDRIRFDCVSFSGEHEIVVWSDIRQFGFVKLVSAKELEKILSQYGPEPLETSAEDLAACIPLKSKRSIKAVLLDQSVIAGVGNIYADEACFRAGILPTRPAGSLSKVQRISLMEAVKSILTESVNLRGTSASDYLDTEGNKGGFLALLKVYGRKGEACVECKKPIKKIVHAQRGTHFCANCQE